MPIVTIVPMTRTAKLPEGKVGKYGGGESIVIHDIRK
jgi:hypothetical protein